MSRCVEIKVIRRSIFCAASPAKGCARVDSILPELPSAVQRLPAGDGAEEELRRRRGIMKKDVLQPEAVIARSPATGAAELCEVPNLKALPGAEKPARRDIHHSPAGAAQKKATTHGESPPFEDADFVDTARSTKSAKPLLLRCLFHGKSYSASGPGKRRRVSQQHLRG